MADLQPFQNESETLRIGELTVENRTDQLEMYGSLNITRDQAGLRLALQMKALLDATVLQLQKQSDLPEQMALRPTDSVENPFKE